MGYIKTKWLMLFKDYNSLKENNLEKVDNGYYLKNSSFVEESLKNCKNSIFKIVFTVCS